MKPGYTTVQFKYANALNASSRAILRAYIGGKEGAGYALIYIRRKTALKSKELDI